MKITFKLFLTFIFFSLSYSDSAYALSELERSFIESYKKAFEAKDGTTLESCIFNKTS